ncbi:hypothetical protein MHBO_000359 [Bonamia ostreae]|uniref:Uncharacterized protein n=1 Tax=Bonamia ostreae TaxID=126728 RepID=A0ABV2AFF1_9EUKA
MLLNFKNPHSGNVLKHLEKLVHIWKSDDKYELEVKHYYLKSGEKNDFRFVNGTTKKNAEYLKNAFNNAKNELNVLKQIVSSDKFFTETTRKNAKSSIRKSTNEITKEETIIRKTRIEDLDANFWLDGNHLSNLRFSLSKEELLPKLPENLRESVYTRKKKREILEIEEILSLELTEIVANESKFEFEIELIKSQKSLKTSSTFLAQMMIAKIVETFSRQPMIRATLSLTKDNLFKMETVNLVIRKSYRGDNYNLYCSSEQNSEKLLKVTEGGIELCESLEEKIKLYPSNKKICGKFYYNLIEGKWKIMHLLSERSRITDLSELFEIMERRVAY